jgi:hypothetical protein
LSTPKPIHRPLLLKKKLQPSKQLKWQPGKKNLLLLKQNMRRNSQSKSNKLEKLLLLLKK